MFWSWMNSIVIFRVLYTFSAINTHYFTNWNKTFDFFWSVWKVWLEITIHLILQFESIFCSYLQNEDGILIFFYTFQHCRLTSFIKWLYTLCSNFEYPNHWSKFMLSTCIIYSHLYLFNQYLLSTNYTLFFHRKYPQDVSLPKWRGQKMNKEQINSKFMV